MRKILLLILFFSPFYSLLSQNGPGGISDCVLWLKADKGTMNGGSEVTTFGAITQWLDQSGSDNHTNSYSDTPFKTRGNSAPEKRINYNPVIFFDSDIDLLVGPNLNMNGDNTLTEFYVFQLSENPTEAYKSVFSLGFNSTGSHRLENDFFANSFALFDDNFTNNLYSSAYNNSFYDQSIKTGLYDGNSFKGFHNGNKTSTLGTSDGINANGLYKIGNVEGGTNNDFSVGEIIIFNNTITKKIRRQVETYLAIKYGITLSHSYFNFNNDTIYKNNNYANDIIGIARDDASGLMQKQSHQLHDKDSTRLYLSTLAISNPINSGNFPSDQQYIMMGHNNMALNGKSFPSEFPSGLGIYNRIEREWKLTNTNFSGTTFSIDIKLEDEPININDLRLLVDYNDADDDGDGDNDGDGNFTNAILFNPTMTISNNILTISGLDETIFPINSIRHFTIASINSSTPLPIELNYFNVELNSNEKVKLSWQTATENNNNFFSIEKSKDGQKWELIGKMKGAGFSSSLLNYFFIDNHPFEGTSYYRLKQTDFNGDFEYSTIKKMKIDTKNQEIQIYPNPTENIITIEGIISELEDINIYNVLGQNITYQTLIIISNKNKVEIDLSKLNGGSYLIKTKTTINHIFKK